MIWFACYCIVALMWLCALYVFERHRHSPVEAQDIFAITILSVFWPVCAVVFYAAWLRGKSRLWEGRP